MSSTINALTSGGGVAITGDTSGSLALQTNNGTTAVTVDTSQNVGIGTGSPSRKLTVYATGSSVPAVITNDQTQARLCFKDSVTALDYTVGIGSIGENLASYTGGTERMRIDSSGNLLLNTTSTVKSGKMSIVADGSAVQALSIRNSNSGNSLYYCYFLNSSDNPAGSIQQTGATTVSYVTSSDYRLKENVEPMTGALAKVNQLKPVTYKWKIDGSSGQGFIAHELQAIVPDCVTGEKDGVDKDGNPDYQGIDTSFLVATLTAAIQELNAKVDAQAATITALQAKVGN